MNKINTTPITPTVGFPVKKGTIDFIQNSHAENISDFLKMFIGINYLPSTVYVLYGCVKTLTGGGDYDISEGSVFANGEIFHSPAQTVPAPGVGNTIVLKLVTTQDPAADPVIFTDLVSRNVHDIRRVEYDSSGASGTGNLNGSTSSANDYDNIVFLYSDIVSIGALAGAVLSFERNKTVLCTGSGSTSFSLTDVNAVIGSELHLFVVGTAPVPSLSDGAGTGWNIVTYSYSTGGFGIVACRLRYLGKNAGTNYVTFEAKGYIPPL